jgi:hypothetical protein
MHTPGPWEVRWGCNVFATRLDTGHEGVVASCGGHSSNTVDCRPENTANARLIAAAPDLLAVLERYVEADSGPELEDSLHVDAVAAIAKARGQ